MFRRSLVKRSDVLDRYVFQTKKFNFHMVLHLNIELSFIISMDNHAEEKPLITIVKTSHRIQAYTYAGREEINHTTDLNLGWDNLVFLGRIR